MNTKQKALNLTQKALVMLSLEEERHRSGRPIVGALTQLQSSRNQLEQMLAQLESNALPPLDRRLAGMGHMIGDSWPPGDPLGIALLEAEQAYRKVP
jgi:hypothetical protein